MSTEQFDLFGLSSGPLDLKGKPKSIDRRNDSLFLRNQFQGVGRFGLPMIKKQEIYLEDVGLIACTNTIGNDTEYFDYGVHFFVDDFKFDSLYEQPEKTLERYSQYRFCCTPDFSVYSEMMPWRQLMTP